MRLKIIVFAALFLTACNEPDTYIGKWESDGESLQLLKDGKVLVQSQSGDASGTWRPDGYFGIMVSVKVSGKDVTFPMHIESGKLVAAMDGVSGKYSRSE